MDIAVTGGRGYIGRRLVDRLALEGHRVRMLSRSDAAGHEDWAGSVDVIRGDLSNLDALRFLVDDADLVFHCAGEIVDQSKMIETNVVGTLNLVSAMSQSSARLVHLSSVGVYGANTAEVVDPASARCPETLYETSKATAEAIVLRAAQLGEISATVVQPSTVLSTDMPNASMRSLARRVLAGHFVLFGKGEGRANYVHVTDVVEAVYSARSAKSGSVYIVSNDCSVREMIEAIRDVAPVPLRPLWHLPLWLGSAAAAPGRAFPKLPFNPSRLAALTSPTRYDTTPSHQDLGFLPSISVQASVAEIAEDVIARSHD